MRKAIARYPLLTLLISAMAAVSAGADSLHDRIQHANGLLRSGEADAAIERYHEIQVDHPDKPVLDYNIGCAEYEQGLKAVESKDGTEGQTDFSKARESFDRAMQSDDESVRKSAMFNRANALAQTAKISGEKLPREKKAQAFHDAIRAYEDVLSSDPANANAQQNIDHLRYLMKRAMQEPPPQQGAGESDPQEQNKQENSQSQNQPENSQEQQQEQNEQKESQEQQKDDPSKQDPSKPQDQQNSNNQDPQPPAADEQEQPSDQEQEGAPPPEGQTLEALLDSLDQMDKEIQQKVRQAPPSTRIREQAWW